MLDLCEHCLNRAKQFSEHVAEGISFPLEKLFQDKMNGSPKMFLGNIM